MNLPIIVTEAIIPDHNLTFNIKAYRRLSEDEAASVIDDYLKRRKPRTNPKPGTIVTIETMIGFRRGH